MKNLNSTVVLIVAIILGVGLFAGLVMYMKSNKTPETATLPITLEEFSDFQCPACKAYHPVVEEAVATFSKEELDFKYKHFPLTEIHPYAYNAAVASEAAREQGKFSEYGSLLFANQPNLTDEDLLKYAQELELDMDKFSTDLKNPDVIARVDRDIKEAEKRNLNSTPTFFLDGKRITVSNTSSEQLKNAIQKRIDLAKSSKESTN